MSCLNKRLNYIFSRVMEQRGKSQQLMSFHVALKPRPLFPLIILLLYHGVTFFKKIIQRDESIFKQDDCFRKIKMAFLGGRDLLYCTGTFIAIMEKTPQLFTAEGPHFPVSYFFYLFPRDICLIILHPLSHPSPSSFSLRGG